MIIFHKDTKNNLEESIRGSELVFDSVDSLYYKLHKIKLNRSGSYIGSPKWLNMKRQQKVQKIMMISSFIMLQQLH